MHCNVYMVIVIRNSLRNYTFLSIKAVVIQTFALNIVNISLYCTHIIKLIFFMYFYTYYLYNVHTNYKSIEIYIYHHFCIGFYIYY